MVIQLLRKMKFAGRWLEQETVIPSEATQIQKAAYFPLCVETGFESLDICV